MLCRHGRYRWLVLASQYQRCDCITVLYHTDSTQKKTNKKIHFKRLPIFEFTPETTRTCWSGIYQPFLKTFSLAIVKQTVHDVVYQLRSSWPKVPLHSAIQAKSLRAVYLSASTPVAHLAQGDDVLFCRTNNNWWWFSVDIGGCRQLQTSLRFQITSSDQTQFNFKQQAKPTLLETAYFLLFCKNLRPGSRQVYVT